MLKITTTLMLVENIDIMLKKKKSEQKIKITKP